MSKEKYEIRERSMSCQGSSFSLDPDRAEEIKEDIKEYIEDLINDIKLSGVDPRKCDVSFEDVTVTYLEKVEVLEEDELRRRRQDALIHWMDVFHDKGIAFGAGDGAPEDEQAMYIYEVLNNTFEEMQSPRTLEIASRIVEENDDE